LSETASAAAWFDALLRLLREGERFGLLENPPRELVRFAQRALRIDAAVRGN
jgi:hypothetical protein